MAAEEEVARKREKKEKIKAYIGAVNVRLKSHGDSNAVNLKQLMARWLEMAKPDVEKRLEQKKRSQQLELLRQKAAAKLQAEEQLNEAWGMHRALAAKSARAALDEWRVEKNIIGSWSALCNHGHQ